MITPLMSTIIGVGLASGDDHIGEGGGGTPPASFVFVEVRDGSVVNRALFPLAELPQDWPARDAWIRSDIAQIGWTYTGNAFIAPPITVPEHRRRVAKSTIIARLTDEQLDAALAMMTTRQKERWRAPDHPSIYHDDPEALTLLRAIGADPNVILADE